MGSETRFVPQRQPRSTGIAQTQMVNRPATMGVGGLTPPVTASPASSPQLRAQVTDAAAGYRAQAVAPSAAQTRTRLQDARVEIRDNRIRQRGTVLPGPPGSAVQSVELLPNVTKNPGMVAKIPAKREPIFTADELLLLLHLVDTYEGDNSNTEDNREIAKAARGKLSNLMSDV